MMAGSLSPVLSLQRCDEDIDLLSELLGSNSNGSSSNSIDIAESLLSDDMDDLTGYLCRNSKRPNRVGEGSLPGQRHECLDNLNLDCHDSDVSMNLVHNSPMHTTGKSESREDKPITTKATKSRELVYTVIAQKEPKSMNKNAVAARENRQKRKRYIENIEKEVAQLKEENAALKMKVSCQSDSVEKLNEQVKYLQSVIANQSTISALLQNIQNTADVTLKSSWANMRKPVSDACSTLTSSGKSIENCKSRLRKSKRKCVFESEGVLSQDKKLCLEKENTNGNVQLTSDSESSPSVKKEVNSNSTAKTDQDVLNSNQQTSAGVCLHVSGKQVSLEFCPACSKMASTTRFLDDHTFNARPISRHEVAILQD
ncbi:probable basic-leucine zipper transcription factor D [Haliotis asinina]|uniref:probable basic-leucine zipper transcription factor D n=1 Tax=Haliotis asinina TaxID=109174 RepID=UPI003531A268